MQLGDQKVKGQSHKVDM